MSVALENIAGVDSVKVSLQKGAADIQLDAGNKVTLAEIRRVIRTSGYPTKDAQIVARGKLVSGGGKRTVDLLNGAVLPIVDGPAAQATGIVEVTGVSRPGKGKDEERFSLQSVR